MFLGIDVSKKTLDAALLKDGCKARHKVFSNDVAGHTALLQWLGEQGVERAYACLEATGTWAEAIAKPSHWCCTKRATLSAWLIQRALTLLPKANLNALRPTRPTPFSSPSFARCTNRRLGRLLRLKSNNYKDLSAV
jgi:hypothetical protein